MVLQPPLILYVKKVYFFALPLICWSYTKSSIIFFGNNGAINIIGLCQPGSPLVTLSFPLSIPLYPSSATLYGSTAFEKSFVSDLGSVVREHIVFILKKGVFYEKIMTDSAYSYIASRNARRFFAMYPVLYEPFSGLDANEANIVVSFVNTSYFQMVTRWVQDGKKSFGKVYRSSDELDF